MCSHTTSIERSLINKNPWREGKGKTSQLNEGLLIVPGFGRGGAESYVYK